MSYSRRHLLALISSFIIVLPLSGALSAPHVLADESPSPTTVVQATDGGEPEAPISTVAATGSVQPTTVSAGPTTATATAPETTQPPPVTNVEVRPELRVSARYDKPAYDTLDTIGITITVVNVGSVAATEVNAMSSQDPGGGIRDYWGSVAGSDGRIDPGETVETSHSGPVRWYDAEQVVRTTITLYGREIGDFLTSCVVTAPLTQVRGSIDGVLYGDANGNRIVDPGEPLGNVRINLYGNVVSGDHWQLTDDEGRFSYVDIPAWTYSVFAYADGWIVRGTSLTVNGGTNPSVAIRALRPVSETLNVSLRFAKDSYAVGDAAHLLVTLTNRDSVPLENITVSQSGFDTPEWGDLRYGGPGVTVPPAGSSTFDVSKPVTEDDFNNGEIRVNCIFGLRPGLGEGVNAAATVRVPGGIAHIVRGALLIIYTNSGGGGRPHPYPIPGQEVLFKSRFDGQIVARAVTDNEGKFELTEVPAGSYEVTGQWASEYAEHIAYVRATSGELWVGAFIVYSSVPPPPPNPPTTSSPAPTSTSVPPVPQAGIGGNGGLAWTGTNVIWLVIGGLLSIAAGLGLVLRHRQQRLLGK